MVKLCLSFQWSRLGVQVFIPITKIRTWRKYITRKTVSNRSLKAAYVPTNYRNETKMLRNVADTLRPITYIKYTNTRINFPRTQSEQIARGSWAKFPHPRNTFNNIIRNLTSAYVVAYDRRSVSLSRQVQRTVTLWARHRMLLCFPNQRSRKCNPSL